MSSRERYDRVREEQVGLMEEAKLEGPDGAYPNFSSSNVSFLQLMNMLALWFSSLSWKIIGINFLEFLVPSFLKAPEERVKLLPAKLHPTAYLDGIRGLAALAVFNHHFFYQGIWVDVGYGAGGQYYNFLRLPILRLVYNGGAAVTLFFLISGYALSYKPTMLMRSGRSKDLVNNLSSLTFRRLLRLYLPAVASSFLIVCLVRLGAYDSTRQIFENKTLLKGNRESHPPMRATAAQQWSEWLDRLWGAVHVFGWDNKSVKLTNYNVHLWTVPVEFRCSMYLFLVLLGTGRLRSVARYLTVGLCLLVSISHDRWDFVCFLLGMGVAEFDHIQGIHVRSIVHRPLTSSRSKYLWTAACIVGLFGLSRPSAKIATTPGWIWFCSILPKGLNAMYVNRFAATLFVMGVGRLPSWQTFFNRPTVQYFSRISYALYLVHGMVIHTLGYGLEAFIWNNVTGIQGWWYNVGLFLAWCVTFPFTIWVADCFWRAFDTPTANFAKWLETEMIEKHE